MDKKISKTLIKNVRAFVGGRLVSANVAFCDGVITDIVPIENNSEEANLFVHHFDGEIIDGANSMLLPGAIDAHVHFREPGYTEKADIATESLAAAAGGVTYVMDMPNCRPTTTTLGALREKEALFKEKSVVNYGLFFGITQDNIDEALAIPQDEICGYKVFLGSSTGGMLMNDYSKLRKLFSSTDRVIAVHSESEDIIRANMARFPEEPTILFHPAIRSREACVESTKLALKLANETGANLHICHISTFDELRLIRDLKREKKRKREECKVTAEATINHLWFCDKDYLRLGPLIKCNPAIKTEADRAVLRKCLTNGVIDTIATDHAPHLLKDKRGGAYTAASGMPSVQYVYPVMLELVGKGVLDLATAITLMCENPAKRFGIKNRGKIEVGYAADLVLVEEKPFRVYATNFVPMNQATEAREKGILSKCAWSPYENTVFQNHVVATWVNGNRII